MFKKPPPQEKQSLNPADYKHVVVVFGSRKWKNKVTFHNILMEYLARFEGEPILFVSGAAWSGADRMIIDWCKKYKYPCLQVAADWENEGDSAVFNRNTKMARISTDGLGYWNGYSRGTSDMYNKLLEYDRPAVLYTYRENDKERPA